MKCIKCKKEFKITKRYKQDNLCSKCKANIKYLSKPRTKTCIECGKLIGRLSTLCKSCVQILNRNHQYKDGSTSITRTCKICNNPISAGSKMGLCSSCYSKSLSGSNNPNYKNGHFLREFYNSSEYKHWKLSIFERDKRICKICGKKDSRHTFQAHHIYPKRDYKDLVFDLDNGVTLCKPCHESISRKEYQYIEYFKQTIKPK